MRTPHLPTFFLRLLLLGFVLPATAVRADDWPGPKVREVFSESREYFVRVIPGRSIGDSFGFRGMQRGPYASAEFYRQQPDRSYKLVAEAALKNPMAPVEFFVSNDGRLATLDNWHNVGYGDVVALYDPAGRLVRAYELDELFAPEDLKRLARSEASVAWRNGPAYVRGDQKTLLVTAKSTGDFIFDLDSGEYKYCEYLPKTVSCRPSAPPKPVAAKGRARK
jgi:hypothetical protein